MDNKPTSFTHVPEPHSVDSGPRERTHDACCRRGSGKDIKPVVHRFEFVTLAFDKPQTVFRLPQWHWPATRAYNGFSAGARIRGWQLMGFYQRNGWLRYDDVCSVTGTAGGVGLHDEDYARPCTAYPVSKRAHTMIHTRARFAKAWADFLTKEALPETWAKTLSIDGGVGTSVRDCGVVQLLDHAPHPAWVVVPEKEFDCR